jgi:hypothetical protein
MTARRSSRPLRFRICRSVLMLSVLSGSASIATTTTLQEQSGGQFRGVGALDVPAPAFVQMREPQPAGPAAVRAGGAVAVAHVRALDPDAAAMRSPTIARMVDALQRSDVLVYLHLCLPSGSVYGNQTRLQVVTSGWRYVAVWIDQGQSLVDRIMMLGHELQHVMEIAEATDVRDQAGIRRLYSRIGRPVDHGFETAAAFDVQCKVLRELFERVPAEPAPARTAGKQPPVN